MRPWNRGRPTCSRPRTTAGSSSESSFNFFFSLKEEVARLNRATNFTTTFRHGKQFFLDSDINYGTSVESDFAYWLQDEDLYFKTKALVSSIPKNMLAHLNGPITYIGHVDSAMLAGLDDPNNPDLKTVNKQWHPRNGTLYHRGEHAD
jgi:hypothetical protein